MVRFNRFILIFRVILFLFFVLIIISNVPLFISLNLETLQMHFLQVVITIFLIFTLFRIIRLLLTESIDIKIDEDKIITKNLITRKQKIIEKSYIKGYRIERYKWNIIKISGIQSFWEFESKMIVIYSNYKAIIHLKSFNYFGTKKIVNRLELCNYRQTLRNLRFFDIYNYRKI